MGALDLAKQFMDAFFGGHPCDDMEDLLSVDLDFEGPFFKCTTASDYLKSLNDNPPEDASYELIHQYEDKDTACVFYQFSKPGIDTLMAQYFEVKDGKISKIRLVFDASQFG